MSGSSKRKQRAWEFTWDASSITETQPKKPSSNVAENKAVIPFVRPTSKANTTVSSATKPANKARAPRAWDFRWDDEEANFSTGLSKSPSPSAVASPAKNNKPITSFGPSKPYLNHSRPQNNHVIVDGMPSDSMTTSTSTGKTADRVAELTRASRTHLKTIASLEAQLEEARKLRANLENKIDREIAKREEVSRQAKDAERALRDLQSSMTAMLDAQEASEKRVAEALASLEQEKQARSRVEFELSARVAEEYKERKAAAALEARIKDLEAKLASGPRSKFALTPINPGNPAPASPMTQGDTDFAAKIQSDIASYRRGKIEHDSLVVTSKGRGVRSVEVLRMPHRLTRGTNLVPVSSKPAIEGRLTLSGVQSKAASSTKPSERAEQTLDIHCSEGVDGGVIALADTAMENGSVNVNIEQLANEPLVANSLRLVAMMRKGVSEGGTSDVIAEIVNDLHRSLSGMELSLASKGIRVGALA